VFSCIHLSSRIFLFAIFLSIAACNTPDDGSTTITTTSNTGGPNLTGFYFGSVYNNDGSGIVQTIKLQFSGNKLLSKFVNDQDQSLSGDVSDSNKPGVNYVLTYSNQSKVALIQSLNADFIAIAGVDNNGALTVGMLEKQASAHIAYSQESFLGSWHGLQFQLDNSLAFSAARNSVGDASLSFTGDGQFVATGITAQSVSNSAMTLEPSSSLGYAKAQMTEGNVQKQVSALISPNGNALLTWLCDVDVSANFSNCRFGLMERADSLINVELQITVGASNDAMNRTYQFLLGNIASDTVSCRAIRPSGVYCGSSIYISGTKKLKIPLSGITVDTGVTIDFSGMNNGQMAVEHTNSDGVVDNTGNAIFAQTRLRVRSQSVKSGSEYTVVVLQNPDPSFAKAVLVGAQATTKTLWDNGAALNISDQLDSYIQDNSDDGIPATVGAYVSVNSNDINARWNTDVTYEVILSDHISGDASKTQTYRLFYEAASSLPLAAVLPDISEISVDGRLMGGSSFTNATEFNDFQPHTIYWPIRSASQVTHWQVRLRIVNGSASNHLKNREFRGDRSTLSALGMADPNYYWDMPWTFDSIVYPVGDVIKLQIMASNSDNTLAAISAPAYIVPTPLP